MKYNVSIVNFAIVFLATQTESSDPITSLQAPAPTCFPDTFFTYDWFFIPSTNSNGVWYHYSLDKSNWDQALQGCKNLESSSILATILNEEEENGLRQRMKDDDIYTLRYYMWIGGFS